MSFLNQTDGVAAGEVWHVCAYPFDFPLLVERAALDRVVSLGNHAVLELPRNAEPKGYLAPRRAGAFDMSDVLIDGRWAQGSNYDAVAIHGAVIAIDLDPSTVPEEFDPAVHGLSGSDLERWNQDTARWMKQWLQWVSILSSQPVDLRNPGNNIPSRPSTNRQYFEFVDGKVTYPSAAASIDVQLTPATDSSAERVLSVEALEFAASNATADVDPPLPAELRRNSHLATRRGDGRSAMAEIGTAVEAWLTTALGLPSNHKQTLGGLVTSAVGTGMALPGDIQSAFVDTRNDAMHRGTVPKGAGLQRALTIADDVWAIADPDLSAMALGLPRTMRPMRQDLVVFRRPAASS